MILLIRKDVRTKMMNGHEEREVDQRRGKIGKPQVSRHIVDAGSHQDIQRRKSAKSTHHNDVRMWCDKLCVYMVSFPTSSRVGKASKNVYKRNLQE